jgi:iron(III) transport system permease protein
VTDATLAERPSYSADVVLVDRFAPAMRTGVLILLILILAFLTLYPLAMLFYGSLHTTAPGLPGDFNLDGYLQVLSPETLKVLFNTISIAFLSTALSLPIAVFLAWIVARTNTPGSARWEVLITLPFFVPATLTSMSWSMLGNPQVGGLNVLWQALTGSHDAPINIYSYGGIVWANMQYAVPFLFLLIVDSMRAIDPSLEEASRMSGSSPARVFFGITLPLLTPALMSAAILTFVLGVEAFETALFFGTPAGISVVTTEIYDSIAQSGKAQYQYATALAFCVMILMIALIALQWRVLRGRSFQTVTGKGYRPRAAELGPWRWATFAFCTLFFIISTILPIGQMIVGTFFRFYGFYGWDMLTFEHYVGVWSNTNLLEGLRNTMLLGLVGSTITMALGSIFAFIVVRTKWAGRQVIGFLTWLPWLMPGVVLGIGFLWAFAFMPGPVQVYGTIWALLIAYVTLRMPLSVRVMQSSYAQLSFDLEECSRVHGANWWQTLWRILVALTFPSFAAGWIITFFGIMRELSASMLLYAAHSNVLSVELVKMWGNGDAGEVGVAGIFMIFLVLLFRWVQLRFLNDKVRAV